MTATFQDKSNIADRGQILLFPAIAPARTNKPVWFLFSNMQVADIVRKASLRRVPMSPDYVLGVSEWKDEVLPVLSLEVLFGMKTAHRESIERLAVVRAVVNTQNGFQKEMKTMICVAANYQQRFLPMACEPASEGNWTAGGNLLRAAYETEEKMILVIDMAEILKGPSSLAFKSTPEGISNHPIPARGASGVINITQAGV